jgi:hypothetical protein
LLGFQFISVRQNAPEFNSTAEVTAEVMLLLAVQGVKWASAFLTIILLKRNMVAFPFLGFCACPLEY